MSQAKVDRYKQEKKNRAKNIKKKKIKNLIALFVCALLAGAAIGYPLGKVIYKQYAAERDANATINPDTLDYNIQKYWSAMYSGKYSFIADNIASDTDATSSDAAGTDASDTDAE
ncbi:MAG: hypothetical protein NC225_04705 [Clostridium sp.]|nr:hypothetical protein [Clostridium sp.]MCM1398766.1 hypothetical protein [Clostridium sp.]MCM1458602.1 hypothetical protein [Bacteroides sp.]